MNRWEGSDKSGGESRSQSAEMEAGEALQNLQFVKVLTWPSSRRSGIF